MEKIDVDAIAKEVVKGMNEVNLIEPKELDKMLSSCKLDFNKKYDKPIPLIQMIEDNGHTKDVLTTSNISGTIGQAKSKKTFLSTIFAAALLGCPDFAINGNLMGKDLLFFDTEQAPYHVQRISYRLKTLLSDSITKIHIYMLREYDPDERSAMIDYYLKKHSGTYSFVIIDGVADLIWDTNDIRESKKLESRLMKWSAKHNCHINNILHTNPSGDKPRGHLGTMLLQKAETIFKLEKEDSNTSVVSCERGRNEDFTPWKFSINDKGIPERLEMPAGFYNNDPRIIPDPIPTDKGIEINGSFYEVSKPPF